MVEVHGGESQNVLFPDSTEVDDLSKLLVVFGEGSDLGLKLKSRPGIANSFKLIS